MRTAFLLYLVCDLLILIKSTDVVNTKLLNSTSITNSTVLQKEQKQHVDGTTHKSVQQVSNYVGNDEPLSSPQNGALLRGFYVLCGFSALMLMYFVVKSYRYSDFSAINVYELNIWFLGCGTAASPLRWSKSMG